MYDPQVLHANFILSPQQRAGGGEELLAEVKMRMARMLADELTGPILDSPGGVVLSPITWTINDDELFQVSRIAGTINMQRLPDPIADTGFYTLIGGRMHDRSVRVGLNPPNTYLIPWVPAAPGGDRVTLEYRRIPGATAYEFVREHVMRL